MILKDFSKACKLNELEKDFLDACKFNQIDKVKECLNSNVDINATDEKGKTALMVAIKKQHLGIAKLLIDRGANIHAIDKNGWIALLLASQLSGYSDLALSLVDMGADVNAKNKYKQTAFMFACDGGNQKLAQTLIDKGAYTNIRSTYGWTPLTLACFSGQEKMVKFLLNNNVPVNRQKLDDQDILQVACLKGFKDIIATLINDKGMDIDQQYSNTMGKTVLMSSTERADEDVIQFLLELGANIHIKNRSGETVIDIAKNSMRQIAYAQPSIQKDKRQNQFLRIIDMFKNEKLGRQVAQIDDYNFSI